MLELTVTLLLRVIGSVLVINQDTLEFCKHYVFGKQQPRRLPKSLEKITRIHVIKTLFENAAFSPSTLWGNAVFFPYKGDSSWYTHPTMGVVGGFIYKLISYEDKFIIRCKDEWDFNPQMYEIPIPDGVDITVIRPIIKRLGAKFTICQDGSERIGISELWLAQFNENHSFTNILRL